MNKLILKFKYSFGTFWYSEKQNQVIRDIDRSEGLAPRTIYTRPLFSRKVKPYTEMRAGLKFKPSGKWDDYKFVGIGFWHHTTPPME